MIPWARDYPDWHTPSSIPNERVFGILTICRYCLKIIAPQSRWPKCMMDLLRDFPNIAPSRLGFPENWEESPIWRV